MIKTNTLRDHKLSIGIGRTTSVLNSSQCVRKGCKAVIILVGISALNSLQCFNNSVWLKGGHVACEKPAPIIVKGSLLCNPTQTGLTPDKAS